MTRLSTTLLLLFLALLAGGWVLWDLNRTPPPPNNMGPLLPDLEPENVTRIRLLRSAPNAEEEEKKEEIIFEKRQGNWLVTKPVEWAANSKQVTLMLDGPKVSWPTAYAEAGDLEKLGLGKNAIRVTFFHGNSKTSFRIGARSTYQQSIYVIRDGAPKAGMMDPGFSRPYLLPLQEYLEKKEGSKP